MTFQAYLDNIQAKTGHSATQFKKLADAQGFTTKGVLKPGVKAGDVVAWLKRDHGLGHGHAMALYALFKGIKREGDA